MLFRGGCSRGLAMDLLYIHMHFGLEHTHTHTPMYGLSKVDILPRLLPVTDCLGYLPHNIDACFCACVFTLFACDQLDHDPQLGR